jgi:chemosensory pili system protein ChpA (sensor histidine kinase/response regulator)
MKSLLMVEDDPLIRRAFVIRLESMGYQVHSAGNGAGALERIHERTPDLVLLDVSLPGDDGFVVARRIRELAVTANVPIIFVTASLRPDLRQRALGLGAVGFLQKPFHAADLDQAIQASLRPLPA